MDVPVRYCHDDRINHTLIAIVNVCAVHLKDFVVKQDVVYHLSISASQCFPPCSGCSFLDASGYPIFINFSDSHC